MTSKKRTFVFGRAFFPKTENQLPTEILFQPLGNHVRNVFNLVKYWDWHSKEFEALSELEIEASRKRVMKSAKLHDIGKPQKFSLTVKSRKNKLPEISYSFKGHRFLAEDKKEPWVEKLAQGHHDFSIHDIARDSYRLKTLADHCQDPSEEVKKYKQILESDPLAYAKELYILEMCDQIEAEIACKFYGDDDQAESRAFMDFNIIKQDDHSFTLEPWIFNDDLEEISLTLSTWKMKFPDKLKQAMEVSKGEHEWSFQLNQSVKEWWEQESPKSLTTATVTIKRLALETEEPIDCLSIYQRIKGNGGFTPNSMQKVMAQKLLDQETEPAMLLKAPTGSGKTEAILLPALANRNRLILVLPTRSLIEDQWTRIDQYLTNFSKLAENQDRQFSLVVDTGSNMNRVIYKNGVSRKPANNPRRHLFKGDIILTTLDKFIYRYFAFGDKQKSFIFPHRIQQRKTLVCFDEAHSYENIAFTNFQNLVKSLYEKGRSIVLMTATMPEKLVETFDYLEVLDFSHSLAPQPRGFRYLSDISIGEPQEDNSYDSSLFQASMTSITLDLLENQPQRRVIVVVETIKDAVEVYRNLKQEVSSDNLFLYHGRIADQCRKQVYQQIKQRDESQAPYTLVTTRAIEVGCDLNAQTLITQVCPPENLIQRIGRCNRRGDVEDAQVIVVGDRIPDFLNTLNQEAWEKYYTTLSNLDCFDLDQLTECIFVEQQVDDYRVVETFSMLHDYVYGNDLTCEETHKKGVIPTRSWKPSVTLKFEGADRATNTNVKHSITVPIDRLANKNNQEYAHVFVREKRYDPETSHWNEHHPLRWGSAYGKEITVFINSMSNDYGVYIFDELPNYDYDSELGFVDLPKVFIRLPSNDAQEKLLYPCNDKKNKDSKAIISYAKEKLT